MDENSFVTAGRHGFVRGDLRHFNSVETFDLKNRPDTGTSREIVRSRDISRG
jgi:hypothetical protein